MHRAPFFALALVLLGLFYLPPQIADAWRGAAVAVMGPAWSSVIWKNGGGKAPVELAFLKQTQAELLEERRSEEERIEQYARDVASLMEANPRDVRSDLSRRLERQKKILAHRFSAMGAQVIFRDPSSWSSAIWIGLGEADNRAVEKTVIARNSPVLSEDALIGVVEYVGETHSRVRLITDASLVVAVRAMRGGGQNREVEGLATRLAQRARLREDLFSSEEEQERFVALIETFQKRLHPSFEEELLAKGELCGSGAPLWRSRGNILKGTGFNYDFSDEEGPAKDLRTGRVFSERITSSVAAPLLQVGDLLVTSGLDGLFPPCIPVAIVSKMHSLEMGSCFYELEAKPLVGDLYDLQSVSVLPPLVCEK